MTGLHENYREQERAVLVGLYQPDMDHWEFDESMRELELLAKTAGAEVVGKIVQKALKPHSATYVGKGKAHEIGGEVEDQNAQLVIFNNELSPAQQRNLEEICDCKVVDRTQLILDIFAHHATSGEGKLQVELAQLNYLLPRLTGRGEALSRLGAGIGTRGPGETKLEVDRRRIRTRISRLKDQLDQLEKQRRIQRRRRQSDGIPQIAVVGYTNAGKSTLLNRLTGSQVDARDDLFVTLDSTVRRTDLDDGRQVLFSDTVGFIQKLPHHLVAAFRATLEEVQIADLLLHVVDASHPHREQQKDAAVEVLRELDVLDKKVITVYNKIDLLRDPETIRRQAKRENALCVSALRGEGLRELKKRLTDVLRARATDVELVLPYEDADVLSRLYDESHVDRVEYRPESIAVSARVDEREARKLRKYSVN